MASTPPTGKGALASKGADSGKAGAVPDSKMGSCLRSLAGAVT